MQSDPEKSRMSEEVLCVSEYAGDIYLHLRESEVRNYLNYESFLSCYIKCIVVLLLSSLQMPPDNCFCF